MAISFSAGILALVGTITIAATLLNHPGLTPGVCALVLLLFIQALQLPVSLGVLSAVGGLRSASFLTAFRAHPLETVLVSAGLTILTLLLFIEVGFVPAASLIVFSFFLDL